MFILIFFAFLAGIATVLSPCVIPVLPALLSASGGKGSLRPLGTVCGLVVSFVFFTLALTALIEATGISPNILRNVAIGFIGFFGLCMLFPSLGDRFTQVTSSFATAGQKVQERAHSGFWGGFVLGIALGLIWTPCAGPILAAITTLVATSTISFEAVTIVIAYSLGAAIPMFCIIYGGQRAIDSSRFLSKHSEMIRRSFGGLMILAAILIATHLDVKFQQWALKYLPMVNVENNSLVKEEIARLRQSGSGSITKGENAPQFAGLASWINSQPLTWEKLKGKVVLVDFWTYSCINCIRTFPYLKRWYEEYKDKGLVIVGVHTPEFAFEKDRDNVVEATKRFGITHPVALDNNYATWQAFDNSYWPAHYLVDQKGIIREIHFGEGAYMETENAIRHLLGLEAIQGGEADAFHRPISPETYLGTLRGGSSEDVTLSGPWKREREKITAEGPDAKIDLRFLATRVYLVLGGKSDQPITLLLDGKPLPSSYYTSDMDSAGNIFVKEPRKYDLLNLHGNYGLHTLTLKVPPGIEAYAFTFGDEP